MTPSGPSSARAMTDVRSRQPAPPGKGFESALIEFLVVALIGAGAGAGFELLRPRREAAQTSRDTAAARVEPSTIYDLPPIVTNLGAPQDTWIRMEGSIVFDPKVLPHPEAVAARIGERRARLSANRDVEAAGRADRA